MPELPSGPEGEVTPQAPGPDAISAARVVSFLSFCASRVWERQPEAAKGLAQALTLPQLSAVTTRIADRIALEHLLSLDVWVAAPWAEELTNARGKTRNADLAAFERIMDQHRHSQEFIYFCAAINSWQTNAYALRSCLEAALSQDTRKLQKWGLGYHRMAASLLTALGASPPAAPPLYRGLRLATSGKDQLNLEAGSVLHLLPQSFSESPSIARKIANPKDLDSNTMTAILTVSGGCSALCVHPLSRPASRFWTEMEWIAAGIFTVRLVQQPASPKEPLVIRLTQTGGIQEMVDKIRSHREGLRTQL